MCLEYDAVLHIHASSLQRKRASLLDNKRELLRGYCMSVSFIALFLAATYLLYHPFLRLVLLCLRTLGLLGMLLGLSQTHMRHTH